MKEKVVNARPRSTLGRGRREEYVPVSLAVSTAPDPRQALHKYSLLDECMICNLESALSKIYRDV